MLWRSVSTDVSNDSKSSSNEDPLVWRTMVDGPGRMAIGRGEHLMRSRQASSVVWFSTGCGRGSMGDAKRSVTDARQYHERSQANPSSTLPRSARAPARDRVSVKTARWPSLRYTPSSTSS